MHVSRFELASPDPGEAAALARRVRTLVAVPPDVGETVAEILSDVRDRGDAAVRDFTRRYDSERAPADLRVPAAEMRSALEEFESDLRVALEVAATNIRALAEAEPAAPIAIEMPQGSRVELQTLPMRRAGVYAPGGRAAYPSTVLMCCLPAKAAGVEQIALATPPGEGGGANRAILAACALCGVDEVYLMGGAQAVAALALGTQTVPPVDVIVGPGNRYVQEAKRQVAGCVGIDGIAGPSELLVIADEGADPHLIALDLAAQAEHGPDSSLVLVSPSDSLIDAVEEACERLVSDRESVADAPLALVRAPDLGVAMALANAIAPEHLELICDGAEELATEVRAAGCVFVGKTGGTAFGDYVAGSNHVLPTGGAARFAGPLGALAFRRRQALVSLPEAAARTLVQYVGPLARAEGFPVHAESAEARAAKS